MEIQLGESQGDVEALNLAVGANLDGDPYALEGRGLPERAGTRDQVKLWLLDVQLCLLDRVSRCRSQCNR